MSAERPPHSSPSPEERERIREAHDQADPTTFSELPLGSAPSHIGYVDSETHPYPVVEREGTHFVELVGNKGGAAQQIVSKLLKGIINVSDVVPDASGQLHSKIMPLERIQESKSDSVVRGEMLVLELLFGDGDHKLDQPYGGDPHYTGNVEIDNGKAALYDFEMAQYMVPGERPPNLHDRYDLTELRAAYRALEELNTRLGGADAAPFVEAIFKSSRTTLNDAFEAFQFERRASPRTTDAEVFIRALRDKIITGQAQLANRIESVERFREAREGRSVA